MVVPLGWLEVLLLPILEGVPVSRPFRLSLEAVVLAVPVYIYIYVYTAAQYVYLYLYIYIYTYIYTYLAENRWNRDVMKMLWRWSGMSANSGRPLHSARQIAEER